jgi:DNA-binding response OmpR family regulator
LAKIVLVDDDGTMRILLKTLIEMEGHQVQPVTDFSADIAAFVAQKMPDLVIMDVRLGKQNGLAILKAIRGNPDLSKIKILMTSGIDVRDQCQDAGADGFILKPYMPDELLKKISLALAN